MTTATAVTTDGTPAPAGLSTAAEQRPAQARLRSNRCSRGRTTWRPRPSASRPARQRLLGQPGRHLRRRLRHRHRRHAARRHGRRVEQLGHGRRGRPGCAAPGRLGDPDHEGTDGGDQTTVTDTPGLQGPDARVRSTCWPRGPTPRSGRPRSSPQLLPPTLPGDYHLSGSTARRRTARAWPARRSAGAPGPAHPVDVHGQRPPRDIDGDRAVRLRPGTPLRRRVRPADVPDCPGWPARHTPRAGPATPDRPQPTKHRHRQSTDDEPTPRTAGAPSPRSARLLAGGAGLGRAAVLGGARMLGAPRPGAPRDAAAAAAVTPPAQGRCTWPAPTAGSACRPARPPTCPSTRTRSRRRRFDTYVFGFRDVTGLTAAQVAASAGKAQISAPMLAFDEEDDITITLTNLGLLHATRPLRRAHPALARVRQRHPALRRRAGAVARGADRAATSPTSTARTTPGRTCTTATSRTSSTCRWA